VGKAALGIQSKHIFSYTSDHKFLMALQPINHRRKRTSRKGSERGRRQLSPRPRREPKQAFLGKKKKTTSEGAASQKKLI